MYKELSDYDKTTETIVQYIPRKNKTFPLPAMISEKTNNNEILEKDKYTNEKNSNQ